MRSLHDGRVFDMPQQPYERYVRQRIGCDLTIWAPHCRTRTMPVGNRLRIQSTTDATIRWSVSDAEPIEAASSDTTIGVWNAELDTVRLPVGAIVRFAVLTTGGLGWGELHEVEVVA